MSSVGLSVPRTRRNVATRSARPSSAKVLAGQRNQDRIGGDERVEGQQSERRRGVDENDVEGVADRGEEVLQAPFAIRERDEIDFGTGELAIGGDERQSLDEGRNDGELGVRCFRGQRVVDRGCGLSFEAEAAREVRLGVEVNEEDALLGHGEGGGEIDGRGGLADATLLVGDGDDPGAHFMLYDLSI